MGPHGDIADRIADLELQLRELRQYTATQGRSAAPWEGIKIRNAISAPPPPTEEEPDPEYEPTDRPWIIFTDGDEQERSETPRVRAQTRDGSKIDTEGQKLTVYCYWGRWWIATLESSVPLVYLGDPESSDAYVEPDDSGVYDARLANIPQPGNLDVSDTKIWLIVGQRYEDEPIQPLPRGLVLLASKQGTHTVGESPDEDERPLYYSDHYPWLYVKLDLSEGEAEAGLADGATGDAIVLDEDGNETAITTTVRNRTGVRLPNEAKLFADHHAESREWWVRHYQPKTYLIQRCYEYGKPEVRDIVLRVTNDLAGKIGKTLKRDDGKCYEILEDDGRDLTGNGLGRVNNCAICIAIVKIFDDCETCQAPWKFTNCDDPEDVRYTWEDFSDYDGRTVELLDDAGEPINGCFEVAKANPADVVDPVKVSLRASYVDCAACGTCYDTVNCHDEEDTAVYKLDLDELFPGKSLEDIVSDENVVEIDGVCRKITGEAEDCSSAERPGSATPYESCEACGVHKFQKCGTSEVLCVHKVTGPNGTLDPADYPNHSFRRDDGECWEYLGRLECTDPPVEFVSIAVYPSCADCLITELRKCEDDSTLYTYSDNSSYAIGDIIRRAETTDECYEIIARDPGGFGSAVEFEIDEKSPFNGCEPCRGTAKYRATFACPDSRCGDPEELPDVPDIVTNDDWSAAVGKYLKIKGLGYAISETDPGETVTDTDVEFDGPFTSCEELLVAVSTWSERLMLDMVVGDDGSSWVKTYKTILVTGNSACPETQTIAGDEC